MRLLFDSDVLIRSLNGTASPAAKELLDEGLHDGAMSVISRIEVLTGSVPSLEAGTRAYLATFTEVAITAEVAEHAIRVRRDTRLKLPDAIIYATALVTGRILVTYNSRDFSPRMPSVILPA